MSFKQFAPWMPGAVVVVWWIWELSFHWASLVEYKFGWIVVVLAGFLAWERWPTKPPMRPGGQVMVVGVLGLCGFLMVLAAELYRIGLARTPTQAMLFSLGCASFVIAHMLSLLGWQGTRHFLFPVLFFFVAVPIPKFFWNPVVFGLQHFVASLNVEALNLLGIPAIQQNHVIQLPNTTVGVDEACSGVRSLQSSIMAALFIGDLTLRRVGWKFFFLAVGVLLAVMGNFGRSFYLSLTAHKGGPDALKAVHDSAGWSVLVFTAAGMACLAWAMTGIEKRVQQALASTDAADQGSRDAEAS
ncbi:MAG: exosortase/archaeosortase family protein [Verrucomicrobiota bacterium]